MGTKDIKVENKKIKRCRYSYPYLTDFKKRVCVIEKSDKDVFITEEICEECSNFDSKYIEYPLTINGIENEKIDMKGFGHECGCLCEIQPCGEEYEGKTYLGFYLGDLPIGIHTSYNKENGILSNSTIGNPAIFIPELKKIIFGCESWWREILSIDDFKGISEDEINNTWYVQLLKQMSKESDA